MRTSLKKKPVKAATSSDIAKTLKFIELDKLAKKLVIAYGGHTLEERALPDFRDGLKPVHRRILWAMHNLNLKPSGTTIKSARVVGDAMSKYHPHGDQAIYDALVTMTGLPRPLADSAGNFGRPYHGDVPAAMRYTETKLTKFAADNILPPVYMDTIPLHDNYDGKDKEPLYLPALVPNLLLNGTWGIATGATSVIPPFHKDGLYKLIERAINGNEITAKDCAKNLVINYPLGGQIDNDESSTLEFFTTGRGAIRMLPDFTFSSEKKELTITGAPMGLTIKKINDRLGDHAKVSTVIELGDIKTPINTLIRLKNTVSGTDVKTVVNQLVKLIGVSIPTSCTVTKRELDATGSISFDEENKKFFDTTIPDIINMWVEYRIDLERRMQTHVIETTMKKIADHELMIRALDHIDAIIKIIRTAEKPAVQIAKKLSITLEEANRIMDITLRRLTRLSEQSLKEDIANMRKQISTAKRIKAEPNSRILELLNAKG